jgi:hypothetical protein
MTFTIRDKATRQKAKAINKEYRAMQVQMKTQKAPMPVDTVRNLSDMSDAKRTELIKAALEEEERFKNYEEKTEQRTQKGEELTVREIMVGEDYYEMQVDRKNNIQYFKNGKPVTKITFDFETTRRMVDVLNTIRQVEKFKK